MVVRRVISPPALPFAVGPIPSNWPEHVAAHDRRAQSHLTRGSETIINALGAALLTPHLAKGASCERPIVELQPTDTKRIVEGLVRPCGEAIERHAEVVYAKLWH